MVIKQRHIAIFSGKRGGFGALMELMSLIQKDPDLQLSVILSDMHLSSQFGNTADEVEKYFPSAYRIALNQMGDSGLERSSALGRCLLKTAQALSDINPAILVLLGDRGETLSAAIAAMELNIPIAHILGGDIVGNRDGNRIHAITKLAHLHFPSSADSYQRIVNLGEEPWRVHSFGATYVDYIVQKRYTPNKLVRKKYGLKEKEKYFICIQHPTTLREDQSYQESENVFNALKDAGIRTLIIYPCNDQGYKGVLNSIDKHKSVHHFSIYKNIEALDFWGLMAGAALFIGNSSSGLIETPYFNLPTINLGMRQMGRTRDNNVLDSSYCEEDIKNTIEIADSQDFRNQITNNKIFGDGYASEKVLNVLKTTALEPKVLMKIMTY